MKYYMLVAVMFMSCLISSGELSKDELKQLQDVEIAGTRTDTWKNDDREKLEVLEVNTFQNTDDPLNYDMTRFRIRLAVELTDKTKTKYIVQFIGSPSNDYDSNYQGQDYWKLYMVDGDLERLKITGFAVQYGIMDGETFIPLAAEQSNYEKMMAGLSARTTRAFPNKFYLRHYYIYDDTTQGSSESIPQNVRFIKE